jgi:hypothetical protein
MKRLSFIVILVLIGIISYAQVPDVEIVLTTTQIEAAGSPLTTSDIELLACDDSGALYFSNAIDTNDSDGFAIVKVTSPGPSPTLTVLAGATEIHAAIDAANGGDPAPTNVTLRGMDVDSSNRVILAFDPTGSSDSWLIRITPGSPATVEAIAGAATPNYIDGVSVMTVVGTTAYIIRNGYYVGSGNTQEDSVATFSTDGTANPSQAGTLLVNETTLTGASMFNVTNTDLAMSESCDYQGGDVLIMDSGAAGSSDSIGRVTSAGATSMTKLGTEMETDLSYTDVGFASIAANTSNGNIYLWLNDYNTPTTDGNAFLVIPGGTGTTEIIITESEIQADFSATIREWW